MKPALAMRNGLKASVPIMIGYLPLAMTFGIAGAAAGLLPWQVLAISGLVFAGASQFLLLASIQSGIGWSWVVMLCALLNLRHLLYGPLLSRMLPPRLRTRMLLAFGLSDEVFSIALNRLPSVGAERGAWMAGLGGGAWIAWVGGTALGAFAGTRFTSAFPFLVQVLAFALPALFLTLAIKSTNRASRLPASASALTAGGLTLSRHGSLGILAGAAVGCLCYFLLHRKRKDGR
ncbi:branched-chain amino acid ABC transporter permease [Oxalobacteraceae bacterium CAVE-383]|nr:branched-chain amino acid ABC transporter permease [Oxalobacteraceae bacterium CAVE-383]